MMDQVNSRVAAIDGCGLPDPTKSALNQVSRKIDGLRTTVNQVTLTLEGLLTKLQSQVSQLAAAVKTAFPTLVSN
jgi:hypothetical protein